MAFGAAYNGLEAPAVGAVKAPTFEQGRGVVLAERPTYLDAPRNIVPGSISQRDSWGRIVWSTWGAAVAGGTATYFWHTQGDILEYPSAIRLEGLQRCRGDMVYTRIVGTFVGPPPPDLPATVTTPTLRFSCAPPTTRGCPHFGIGSSLRATSVQRAASIPCGTGRRLIRATYRGKARRVKRTAPGRPTYIFKGGWRCGTGAGGVGCTNVERRRLNVLDGRAITASTG